MLNPQRERCGNRRVFLLSGKCRVLEKSSIFINQYIFFKNYDKIFL